MSNPVEVVLIGAGNRGAEAYADYALRHPDELRIVAVAEPRLERRAWFAAQHSLPPARCFTTWEDLLTAGQLGQGAIVATQDQAHVAPAVTAMTVGYDVLLEKPMAHTLAGCVELVQAAEQTGRTLQICHVLRYAPFWRRLHEVVESGVLGEIVTVEHRENVAFFHMAHSFVRGNWRNRARSSPMILAKCCHDLDVLVWNLRQPVRRLSSVGSLLHFRSDQVGPEIPDRCTDGCPIEAHCPFSALAVYVDYERARPGLGAALAAEGHDPAAPNVWPFTVLTADVSRAGRRRAVETGPYGRCVYRCDNDVVDQQTVLMELASGASVTLVMHGHSNEEHRSLRYDGTRATLRARTGAVNEIEVCIHGGKQERISIDKAFSRHGGGDDGLMHDYVRVLRGEMAPLTPARISLESHLLAFAAEEARLTGAVIDFATFRRRAELIDRGFGG